MSFCGLRDYQFAVRAVMGNELWRSGSRGSIYNCRSNLIDLARSGSDFQRVRCEESVSLYLPFVSQGLRDITVKIVI